MTFQAFVTRRTALALGAGALAAAGLPTFPAMAQNTKASTDQLMAKQALPDVWMGKENAPVTIIEYASMTCSHCASFHAGTFKELKSKYIDTGKVRMTLREFPFDPLATAAFMLARCEGPEKRGAMIDLLFAKQRDWAASDKPFDGLVALTKQAGMSQDAFEKCLKDKDLYDNVSKVRDQGTEKFNVRSTPTFFINGTMLTGDLPLDQFAKIIDPLVAGNKK